MKFYTDAFVEKGISYCRGYEDGKRFTVKESISPYIFLQTSKEEDSPYKTLDGKPLIKKQFNKMGDYWNFVESHPGLPIYGNLNFVYQYMNDTFSGEVQYDISLISKVTIDIEVLSKEGFPDPHEAKHPVVSITLTKNNKKYVIGMKEYTTKEDEKYWYAKDENRLFEMFLFVWRQLDPDVVTGWNTDGFDIPYIVNRINNLFGWEAVEQLSPWGKVYIKEVETKWHGKMKQYLIKGIALIDYLPLYKKFTQNAEESYSLNHIAQVTIDEKKVDYSEYGSLHELYEKDYQKFMEYNVYDCVLVDKIEDRLGYIVQAIVMAYNAKVNYVDVFGTVKPWDVIITNELLKDNIVVPPQVEASFKDIMGGYVKKPQLGAHQWIVTFDYKSLYPHIVMACNISPETNYGKNEDVTVESLLEYGYKRDGEDGSLKHYDICLTGEGSVYRRSPKGILPRLMEKFFDIRNESKKRLKDTKKKYEVEPSEALLKEMTKYDNLQKSAKIFINGLYGCMANRWFRLANSDNAEAVTSTGQFLIRFTEKNINKFLNNVLKTEADYVVAIDTDSVHISLDALVKKVCPDAPKDNIVNFIDKVCKEKLSPLIERSCMDFCKIINAAEQKFEMVREEISSKAIWRAAKMYILNVEDSEGFRYKEPVQKIKGIEAVRSSTPHEVRIKIKQALKIVMNGTEQELHVFIDNYRKEFDKQPFDEVGTPSSVKGLTKYADPDTIFIKRTPRQVKASLIYNNLIREQQLTEKYALIHEGDKVRYAALRLPNPIRQEVIAAPDKLPSELGLETFIDYDHQFEKAFIKPVETLIGSVNWTSKKRYSMEDFLKR